MSWPTPSSGGLKTCAPVRALPNSMPSLIVPLLKGESVEERLGRDAAVSIPEVLRIGREIALGLSAAHERGLIHRDVKPANVFLVSGGVDQLPTRVKLLDFGLARVTGDATPLTQPGVVLGTPAYMAPEQVNGGDVDQRGDLFSLGCVLYRLCTAPAPFPPAGPLATPYALT